MGSGESYNQDKRHELYSELARNIVWAQGDVLLNEDQQIRLYGNGVSVTFIDGNDAHSSLRKKNPLPIADVTFSNQRAEVVFNEEDYRVFLKDICRPANIDGHMAASYYIGIGVAYKTLDKLFSDTEFKLDEDPEMQYALRRDLLDIITKPIPSEEVEFVVSNIADHDPDVKNHAKKVFENIFLSNDERLGRINTLRFAVSAHIFAMEQSNSKWQIWRGDNGDRVTYAMEFMYACTLDLIDEIKIWRDKLKLASIFSRKSDFKNMADSVPELSIAGSLPMSLEEINSILKLTLE